MSEGSFDLNDFLVQMNQIKRMGSLKKLMGMLPGMGQYREALEQWDESSMGRVEAIIQSMTPAERRTPKILNGSRRQRIARGSGTTVQEVNQLVQRFEGAAKMMTQMSRGGGMPGMPGMPGVGGGSRKQKRAKKNVSGGKKGRSGNPAKRARQEAEAAAARQRAEQGSAFGKGAQLPGAAQAGPDMASMEELKRFLK